MRRRRGRGPGAAPGDDSPSRSRRAGTRSRLNDWGRPDYGGPCPPIGRHCYFHRLYALDVDLAGLARPTKAELARTMAGHVLAETALVGTYEKAGR